MLVSLDHVGMQVRDLAPVRQFYEGVLGLKATKEKELPAGPVRRLLFLEGDGFVLELLHCPDVEPVRSFHLSFEVASISQIIETMKGAGREPAEPPREATPRSGEQRWLRVVFFGPASEKLEFIGPA